VAGQAEVPCQAAASATTGSLMTGTSTVTGTTKGWQCEYRSVAKSRERSTAVDVRLCGILMRAACPTPRLVRSRSTKNDRRTTLKALYNKAQGRAAHPGNTQGKARYQITSSRRACAQVRQVMHTQAARNFGQPFSAGREEAARRSPLAQLRQPGPPALRAAAQPIKDSG